MGEICKGDGGKGNMPIKISQGKGVCIGTLAAEHISSLFNRLFARDKHLGEAKLPRTLFADPALGRDVVMLVMTWCHTGGHSCLASMQGSLVSFGRSQAGEAGALGHLPAVGQGRVPAGQWKSCRIAAAPLCQQPPLQKKSHSWAERGC